MPLDNLSHFDEKSGVVPCNTDWGCWWQTVHEVHIEVNLPKNTKAKEVSVKVCPNEINCTVCKNAVFKVQLAILFICVSLFFSFFLNKYSSFQSSGFGSCYRVDYTVQCMLTRQFGLSKTVSCWTLCWQKQILHWRMKYGHHCLKGICINQIHSHYIRWDRSWT